jgi:glycosyltransferase involved in cell wall biosynthesis
MPTVAVDVRGAGPGGPLLAAELRGFAGLRVPPWRPWSRLLAPDAVHALGGRPPPLSGCPVVLTLTAATSDAALRSAALVLCPSQAAMAAAGRRPGARPERLRVVPLAPVPAAGHSERGGAAPGPRALALAPDPAALRRAWRAAGVPVELELLAAEPPTRALAGAVLFADLREDVLFGGAALAALALGVPVVAAAGGAAAEAVGDAGAVAAPADADALAGAIRRALAASDAGAVAARRERAALFTWRGTAEATVMAYRDLW